MRSSCFALVVVATMGGCGPRPLEPRDPTPGVPHFVVQTFNVEFEHWGDPATVEAVGHENADIVCLQEVTYDWERVIRKRYASQYPNMIFYPNGGTGGLAALSRYPLEDLGLRPGPNGWHPAWHFLVHTPMGPVQVLNVHLRSVLSGRSSSVSAYVNVSSDHQQEIQLFTADCSTTSPTLVVGDFNEEPGGSAIRYLENEGFQDALWLYHPGQWTWHHPSLGDQFAKAFDHILFDSAFEPLNSWVTRRGNSDHIPVLAHLEASAR